MKRSDAEKLEALLDAARDLGYRVARVDTTAERHVVRVTIQLADKSSPLQTVNR